MEIVVDIFCESFFSYDSCFNYISSLSTTIGVVVAFVYATITLLMFAELRRTRIQSSKPHLVLLHTGEVKNLFFKDSETTEFGIKGIPEIKSISGPIESSEVTYHPHPMEVDDFIIKNIGTSPALNISINWSLTDVNLDLIKSNINSMNNLELVKFQYNEGVIVIKTNSGVTTFRIQSTSETYIPICIATPNSDHINNINMPFMFAMYYLFTFLFSPVKIKLPLDQLIKIKCAVKYQDLDGNKYQKDFFISHEILFTTYYKKLATNECFDIPIETTLRFKINY